ncbi:MAG: hypothetical protein IT372_34125 [Polyangiaceae bacterium]|nr:hypothetical protein [Polyangiaceae bacterium]
MAKSDELDRTRAAAYAWRRFMPGEDVTEPDATPPAAAEAEAAETLPPPGAEPEAPDSGATAASFRDESQRLAAALADGIDRAWSLPEAEQAAAVSELARRAGEMGLMAVAMENHPRESVRLFRLALRWWDRLPPDARDAARRSLAWSDLSHPEVVDLFADALRTPDPALHGSIALALAINSDAKEALARMADAGARFAGLLDELAATSARRAAIFLIGAAGQRSAAQALRRALRPPCFSLRWRALDCLADHFPDAVEPGDVLFLLEEVIDHAPPWIWGDEENRRTHCYFPGLLAGQINRLRPAGAAALLARLVDGDCDPCWYGGGSLDAEWAFAALAETFPDEALPRIDAHLRHVDPKKRRLGAAAAGRLPDDLAWPRLLAAAADPVPEIAELAQSTWLSRRGALCRFDELAGLEIALLDGPPSDRMRARIPLMRTGPLAARAAMAEVLLGEAPDPEALVLLLFALGDEDLWQKRPRPGLPDSRKGFARAVAERFGARGVLGLIALAERYTDDTFGGFVDALADLFHDGVAVPEECHPALRALARRRLDEIAADYAYDPLTILAHVGAPAEAAPRLAALAWSADVPGHVAWAAGKALAAAGRGDPGVDELLLGELSAALAAGDLRRFARALPAALRRRLPAAIELAEREIARLAAGSQDDPAITAALTGCADALAEIDRSPAACERVAATAPGTYAFALACRRLRRERKQKEASTGEVEALEAALGGRSAAAAVEAALALLHIRKLEATDPRVPALAARAPLPLRAELLAELLIRDVPARPLWPLIAEVLVSPDPLAAEELCHHLFQLDKAGLGAELRAIEPRVVNPKLRQDFDEWLYLHEEGELYWQDEIEAMAKEQAAQEQEENDGEDDGEQG